MRCSFRPSARANFCGSWPRLARVITSAHRGPAPLTPLTLCMLAPSKLPTQTPTVWRGVKPTVQLSRKSLEVPVFTAAGKGRASGEFRPKAGSRAM